MKRFEKDTPWAQMETAVGESFDIYQAALNRKQECDHDEAARLFRMSADLGFTEAMVELAICYREGWGVVKNETTSIEHFTRAADKGHMLASFAVGQHFAKIGDKDQAAKYFLTAHEEYHDLAVRYHNGEDVDFPVVEMEKDTEMDELYTTGEKLMYGTEDTSADPEGALEYLLAAADKGHTKAQFEVGMAHATGTGTDKDMQTAFRFFKLAADQGHSASQAFVGETYLEEPVDMEKALLYLDLAAYQGNAAAQRNLGYLHATGNGMPQDMERAVICFRDAAAQEDYQALSVLATCYITGAGVEKCEDTARELALHADELGYHEALYVAGQVYEKGVDLFGHEVPKNMSKAVEFYHRAAERGNPDALYSLGGCYYMGNGAEKDTVKAKEYLRRAVKAGHEKAAVMYGKIESSDQ